MAQKIAQVAERPLTGPAKKFAGGIQFEMDEKGNFRIVTPKGAGEWTGYSGVATSCCGKYLAVSAYFAGGKLVPEQVYEIAAVASNKA